MMDRFAHIFLGSRLGFGPEHMQCRDHSNHDRRKIVGKRTAMYPVREVHGVCSLTGPEARDSVTTQIMIGEINPHTGWLDRHQSLTGRQLKRNR